MKIVGKIVFMLLWFALAACHPMPRDVRQAARDALENARIQLDSGNKTEALQLFKEAEHYGLMADDTLTVARARYNIGHWLSYDGHREGVVPMLKAAEEGFGDNYAERAMVLVVLGDIHQFRRDYDSAEYYLNQALEYAEKSGSTKAKRAVFSEYHVTCFNAHEYEKAGDYLRRFWQEFLPEEIDDELRMYYCHNMGNVFFKMNEMDSAAYYYGQVEKLLLQADDKVKDKEYYYFGTLANLAEAQGDYKKACEYISLFEIGRARDDIKQSKNNLALVNQKYDSAVMQNELNEKIIRNQRVIIIICGLAALVLAAFLVSQIRLAKRRKREAEINAELFHFKQQNKALAQKDAEHVQIQQDYAARLSDALMKEQRIMLLWDNYLNNNKKAHVLNDLETSIFGDKDHWEAMLEVVDQLYPDLMATLQQKYPDLDEDERKSYILSYFKLSRQEEADYLGTSVNMVDKVRGRRRKKMEEV